jgi:Calcium-binding EGF domain
MTANCIPDACTVVNDICGANSFCNTTTNPASCRCIPGYDGNTTTGCVDFDECSKNPCPSTSTVCNNTPGSYQCLIKEFFSCTKGLDSLCFVPHCARTSRSDSDYVCCPDASPCFTNEKCCNGAYFAGEQCPSGSSLDCDIGLSCARRGAFDGTLVCCSNTYTIPLVGLTCQ